jgi:hypothetical protein
MTLDKSRTLDYGNEEGKAELGRSGKTEEEEEEERRHKPVRFFTDQGSNQFCRFAGQKPERISWVRVIGVRTCFSACFVGSPLLRGPSVPI